jgi:hypothetical protein
MSVKLQPAQSLYKLRTDCFLPLTWSHFEFSDPSARLTLILQYIDISLDLPKFINVIKGKIYDAFFLSRIAVYVTI